MNVPTTFVLGAGFSKAAGFPLVRELTDEILDFLVANSNPSWDVHLKANDLFPHGQFWTGFDAVDPNRSMAFEELLAALARVAATHSLHPAGLTEKVLRLGCARLLWHKQNSLTTLPSAYKNFALRIAADRLAGVHHGFVSFNWDVLMEWALQKHGVPWLYWKANGPVPVLKPHGSINWSKHLLEGLTAPVWSPLYTGSKLSWIAEDPFSDPFPQINYDRRFMLFPTDAEFPEGAEELRRMWDMVGLLILERPKVVFLGYSLPPYDEDVRNVLKRVCGSKIVEVYNPSDQVLSNFGTLFGRDVHLFAERFDECKYAATLRTANTGRALD